MESYDGFRFYEQGKTKGCQYAKKKSGQEYVRCLDCPLPECVHVIKDATDPG